MKSSSAIKLTVALIVQARLSSSRFPGKVLEKITSSENVLSYLLKRLSRCKRVDKIIVATTTSSKDDLLEKYLTQNNYLVYRGSEVNCLERYYEAAKQHKADVVIRITADCPLVIPEVVDEMVAYYLINYKSIDYLSNRQYTNFPEGVDVEVFGSKNLKKAIKSKLRKEECEHINYYFLNRSAKYRIRYYNHTLGGDYSRFKLSIDTPEDLDKIRQLLKKNRLCLNFTLSDLIAALNTE